MLLADTLTVIGLATLSLGTIHEADGPVEHTFWLRNDGRESVALVQGYTSCGCTTIHFDHEATVVPGDSAAVALRFNPRGKGGEFLETATVAYCPASDSLAAPQNRKRLQLALEGVCITSEETLMRQFPIRIDDHLRLSADRFDLGRMRPGESRERSVVVLHFNDTTVNSAHLSSPAISQERIVIPFTVTDATPKGLQHISCPFETVSEGRKVQLTVTFDVFVL